MSSGGCAKGSLITLSDGTKKKVEDIKKGDKIITVNIEENKKTEEISEIECLVINKCKNGYEYMVNLDNNLKITPYYPIYTQSMLKYQWVYPINISASKPQKIESDKIYTFIVKNRKSVIVNDYIFATLGNNLVENDVIKHDYFGTNKVIGELKEFTTYNTGYVLLDHSMYIRGRDNNIRSIISMNKTFVETLYFANL